jgi:hypothetical protein
MAEVDPDQEAALRRLRGAFGFVEVLRVVDHHDDQDQRVRRGQQRRPPQYAIDATSTRGRPVTPLSDLASRHVTSPLTVGIHLRKRWSAWQ